MSSPDIFGLQKEKSILKSGIRKIFTPHQPILSIDLFFGRQKEVKKIIEQINTPGQHCLLYGDRGVGKSSLANITTQLLISKLIKGNLYSKRCDSNDTFLSIITEPLNDFGYDIEIESATKAHKQSGKAGIKIPIAGAGISSERTTTETYNIRPLTPSTVAEILKDKNGLLYIDEADRITAKDEKIALSELIKLLSDNGSNFKILIVGIAETAEELTGGHPSVNRCLKETFLPRMSNDELNSIVTEGANKCGLTFEDTIIRLIVRLSSGYPHFTHLLALKCAEIAIVSDLKTIDRKCLSKAIHIAVEDAESTLRRLYQEATRSHTTDMYSVILFASSKLSKTEFSANQLREKITTLTGENLSQGALNNFLKRLVADDYSSILHRCAKGIYKFSDPRMASFVKIINAEQELQE